MKAKLWSLLVTLLFTRSGLAFERLEDLKSPLPDRTEFLQLAPEAKEVVGKEIQALLDKADGKKVLLAQHRFCFSKSGVREFSGNGACPAAHKTCHLGDADCDPVFLCESVCRAPSASSDSLCSSCTPGKDLAYHFRHFFSERSWVQIRRGLFAYCFANAKDPHCERLAQMAQMARQRALPSDLQGAAIGIKPIPRAGAQFKTPYSFDWVAGLFMAAAYAAPTCQVDEEALKIASPDGTQIQLQPETHDPPTIIGMLEQIRATPNIPPQFVQGWVKKNLADYAESIKGVRESAEQIRQQVKDGKVSWIGVEASPEYMSRTRQSEDGLIGWAAGVEKFLKDNGVPPEQVSQVVDLSLSGGAYVAWVKYPEIRQKVRMVPLEEDKFYMGHDVGAVATAIDTMKGLVRNNKITVAEGAQLGELVKGFATFTSDITENRARTIADQYPNASSEVFEMLKSMIKYQAAGMARDEPVARNALKQTGSGLVIRGAAHNHNIINHFKTLCGSGPDRSVRQGQTTQ